MTRRTAILLCLTAPMAIWKPAVALDQSTIAISDSDPQKFIWNLDHISTLELNWRKQTRSIAIEELWQALGDG